MKRVFPVEPMVQTATALRQVWLIAGLMALYSLLAVWKEASDYRDYGDLPGNISAAFSMVLGVLLVFRTNRAYERWWEARTLWGRLVNASRNLALKAAWLPNLDPVERLDFRRLVAGFSRALADHLRGTAALNRLAGWEDASDEPRHVPLYISSRVYALLTEWKRSGRLSEQEFRVLEQEAREFMELCGGCERIRNTPIARSYRSFAHKCLLLYLVTIPWGLIEDFGYWTVPVVAVLTYLMVGLEAVAEAVEEPFGLDLDDLDLEGLCRTIDTSVAEALSVQ